MIAHHGLPRLEVLKGREEITYDQIEVNRVIDRLNKFAALCRERQIRVFFSYPPMPETQFQATAAKIRKLHASLHDSLTSDITILDSPQEAVFPDSQFFDTVTHLSEAGQALRSRKLARELVPAIVAGRESPNKSWR